MTKKTRTTWRVFWRILFDVFDGKPRLQLELTLWDHDRFTRLGRRLVDLDPITVGNVSFLGDLAVFNDGCLMSKLSLNHEVDVLLADLGLPPATELDRVAISLSGENVSIRVDAQIHDVSGRWDQPLFYFPQPGSAGVRLTEAFYPLDVRRIGWQISGQAYESALFVLEAFDAYHGVRVRQDRERDATTDIFEFLVDSIPLGDVPTSSNHLFDTGPQTFYIGAIPDDANPGQLIMLHGAIGHLEFDPNNSCPSCPNVTAIIDKDPDRGYQDVK